MCNLRGFFSFKFVPGCSTATYFQTVKFYINWYIKWNGAWPHITQYAWYKCNINVEWDIFGLELKAEICFNNATLLTIYSVKNILIFALFQHLLKFGFVLSSALTVLSWLGGSCISNRPMSQRWSFQKVRATTHWVSFRANVGTDNISPSLL